MLTGLTWIHSGGATERAMPGNADWERDASGESHWTDGMYHVFKPGHSSMEEAWKARPGLHYMCQPSGQGCKRMMQFAGAAHGDYSAIGGGMGFGKVKVNGHEVTPAFDHGGRASWLPK
eukprot:Tamp_43744.p2 GENE.Tamp_43744~~Tamp_43744.p2  ORF type:complete len:119 (+),score=22.94 Tamp_43744:3-359(+)